MRVKTRVSARCTGRTPADYSELIGDDTGVFGCMGLLACDNVCPKQLPLQDQLGIMRRMVSAESVRGILPEFLRKKLQGCGCGCQQKQL